MVSCQDIGLGGLITAPHHGDIQVLAGSLQDLLDR